MLRSDEQAGKGRSEVYGTEGPAARTRYQWYVALLMDSLLGMLTDNVSPLLDENEDVHLFGNDPEGIALVQQLQQRAEAWAEAGILTMIFTTDDYWPYETMKKNASRLRVGRKVFVLLSAIQSSPQTSLRLYS
jgi:hypothetical protein